MSQASRLRVASEYCMSLVKQTDFDNYLAGLLVPRQHRGAYFALRAFNVELATTKDQSNKNSMAARMRFQWWRDVIDNIYSKQDEQFMQQPVAYALSHYCREHGLTRHWLERSLEARQRDVEKDSHESMDDLENYAEQGHSSILYLLLESMNIRNEHANYMASHIGVCSGITTLLRGFPYHVSKRQLYIPLDIVKRHSITVGQLLSGPQSTQESQTALKDCIYDVASQAHGHLDRARSLFDGGKQGPALIPREAIHICGPALRSRMFLDDLRVNSFDPFHGHLQRNVQFKYQLMLLRMRLVKKF